MPIVKNLEPWEATLQSALSRATQGAPDEQSRRVARAIVTGGVQSAVIAADSCEALGPGSRLSPQEWQAFCEAMTLAVMRRAVRRFAAADPAIEADLMWERLARDVPAWFTAFDLDRSEQERLLRIQYEADAEEQEAPDFGGIAVLREATLTFALCRQILGEPSDLNWSKLRFPVGTVEELIQAGYRTASDGDVQIFAFYAALQEGTLQTLRSASEPSPGASEPTDLELTRSELFLDSAALTRTTWLVYSRVLVWPLAFGLMIGSILWLLSLLTFGLLGLALAIPATILRMITISWLLMSSNLWIAAPVLRPLLAVPGILIGVALGTLAAAVLPPDALSSPNKLNRSAFIEVLVAWPASSIRFAEWEEWQEQRAGGR